MHDHTATDSGSTTPLGENSAPGHTEKSADKHKARRHRMNLLRSPGIPGWDLLSVAELGALIILGAYAEKNGPRIAKAVAERVVLMRGMSREAFDGMLAWLTPLGVISDDGETIGIHMEAPVKVPAKNASKAGRPVVKTGQRGRPRNVRATDIHDGMKGNYPITTGPEDLTAPSVSILLSDGTHAVLTEDYIKHLAAAHRGVDVLSEMRRAALWCESNPTKRKTRSGIRRFCTSWVASAATRRDIALVAGTATGGRGFGQGTPGDPATAPAPVADSLAGLGGPIRQPSPIRKVTLTGGEAQ